MYEGIHTATSLLYVRGTLSRYLGVPLSMNLRRDYNETLRCSASYHEIRSLQRLDDTL